MTVKEQCVKLMGWTEVTHKTLDSSDSPGKEIVYLDGLRKIVGYAERWSPESNLTDAMQVAREAYRGIYPYNACDAGILADIVCSIVRYYLFDEDDIETTCRKLINESIVAVNRGV